MNPWLKISLITLRRTVAMSGLWIWAARKLFAKHRVCF